MVICPAATNLFIARTLRRSDTGNRRFKVECRSGLKIRVLFRASAQTLDVFFVGNHDEVRRLIRHL